MEKSRTVINHRYSPAALVHRKKLLLREGQDLPSDLIGLPNFDFTWPNNDRRQGTEKMFVKFLMYLIAAALRAPFRAQTERFVFVSLVEFNMTEENFKFKFMCPYPDIVSQAQQSFKTAQAKAAFADTFKDMEINHKYAIPLGIRVPLVFDYNHRDNRLLIMNHNHMSDPDQFLDPQKCRSTSGFLSFLGTISMLENMQSDVQYMNSIVSFVNTLPNQGLDELLRWLYNLIDHGVLLYPSRILIDPNSPETYYYNYSAKDSSKSEE